MMVLSAKIIVTLTIIKMEARSDSGGLPCAMCRSALAPQCERDANIDLLQGSVPPNP